MVLENFRTNIIAVLKARKITRSKLGETMYLGSFESRRKKFSRLLTTAKSVCISDACRVADVLNIPIEDLLLPSEDFVLKYELGE